MENEVSTELTAVLLETPVDSLRRQHNPTSLGVENVYNFYYGDNCLKVTFFPRNSNPHLHNTDRPTYIFEPTQPWLKSPGGNVIIIPEDYSPVYTDPSKIDWGSLFYICAYPTSLIAAAELIDPTRPHLKSLRESFEKAVKPPAYSEFTDLVIAGKFVNIQGELKTAPDFEGEILILSGLLGNRESGLELLKRKTILERISSAPQPRPKTDIIEAPKKDGLHISDFVAVHTTGFLPYVDSNGVFIRSRFDGSQELETRTCINFTLNHLVVSHKQGNWEERPYILVTPLVDLMELNGIPYSLRPEDTFYLSSPGRPIVLPSTTVLIRPRLDRDEKNSTTIPLRTVKYGFRTFTTADLEAISSEWSNLYWSEERMADFDHQGYFDNLQGSRTWAGYTVPGLYSSLKEFVQARLKYSQNRRESEWYGQHLSDTSSSKTVLGRVINYLKDALKTGKAGKFRGDALDEMIWAQVPSVISRNNLIEDYAEIRDDLEKRVGSMTKMVATDDVIQQLGFELRYVNPYYLFREDDSGNELLVPPEVSKVLEFAEKSGLLIVRHPKMVEAKLEQLLEAMRGSLLGGHETYNPYEVKVHIQKIQQIMRDDFLKTTPETRRMIYLTGAYQAGDYYF